MSDHPCRPLKVVSRLHKALRQLTIHLEEISRPLGLSAMEAHLLAFLACYGPCTVGQLSRVFGLKASSMTGMLDRLEKKEFLHRIPNPTDRRSFLVEVLAKGQAAGMKARKVVEDLEARILEQLAASDMEGFSHLLDAVSSVTGVTIR